MELSKSLTCELHIFISLSQTTRLLKLRRNVVKLSLYQHFTHTLIFSVVGELDFSFRLCQWASIWDILYIILSVLFCVLFICAASVIFMIWTTRQLKFVDCQSVSSLAYIYLAVILWETVLLEFHVFGLSGLEKLVGGRCFLEAALLHHSAGHHGVATTLSQ